MAKIKVTENVVVPVGDTSTVHYEKGFEGTAPHDHIEKIVAAGKGVRVDESAPLSLAASLEKPVA